MRTTELEPVHLIPDDDTDEPVPPTQVVLPPPSDKRYIGDGWAWGAHREWMCGECKTEHVHVGWEKGVWKIFEIGIPSDSIGGQVSHLLQSAQQPGIKLYSMERDGWDDYVFLVFVNPRDAVLAISIAEKTIDWSSTRYFDGIFEGKEFQDIWYRYSEAIDAIGFRAAPLTVQGEDVLVLMPDQNAPPRSAMS